MKAERREACSNHWQLPPDFICASCDAMFCRNCVKVIGWSSGAICPACDSLCLPFAEVMQKRLLLAEHQTPFGFDDFKFALRYPLQETITLLGLAMIYGFGLFSLPFYTIADVGILLGSLGLLPLFLSNAMMFGCALRVIKSLESGHAESQEVFDVIAMLSEVWSVLRVAAAILLAIGWPLVLRLQFGIHSSAFRYVALGWMVFYYPIALLVAALSQSFWSTLNPLVGLNAIIKMGVVYVKILAMYLVVMAVALVLMAAIAKSILPTGFNLITIISFLIVGVISAPPFFYANMVVAALLGRALFKYGDRANLNDW